MDEETLVKVLKLHRQAKKLAEPFKKGEEPDSMIGRMAHRELERRAGWKYRLFRWVKTTWQGRDR